MIDKKFFKPETVPAWCIVVYERKSKFGENHAKELVKMLRAACQNVGTLTSAIRLRVV